MFFVLAIIVVWVLFGTLAYMCKKFEWGDCYGKYSPNSYVTAGIIFTSIFLFITCITTCTMWGNNVDDIAMYRQIDNKITQRDEIMSKNLPEIRSILVDLYPQHERDIFKSIENRSAQWLWEKYPEMRAAETMQNYVSQLNDYTVWVQLYREMQLDLIAKIESSKNSPFAMTWFIPTINNKVELESN